MITASAFFSETLNTVDAVIGNFVSIVYNNFIQANSGMITLVFTFYIMFLGYRFLNHDHQLNLIQITRHIIILVIIYAMVMNWNLYNIFVYNIFTNEPSNIAKILVTSAGHYNAATNIAAALDGIYKSVLDAAVGFFGQVGLSAAGIAFIFYGALVFIIGTILCVFALLLFIYAKMMMAVSLALGPLFILFYLFDATKPVFAAWIKKLLTLALIPIVTSAILVLMLSVINITLPKLSQPSETLQFYGIAPFLGLSLATTLILSQVFRICSALGGGITLSSISQGADIAKSSLEKSGLTLATRKLVEKSIKKSSF